jgi:hypothetical protein
MNLQPDEDQGAVLSQLAARRGISEPAAVLRAIEEAAAREGGLAEVEALGRTSLKRWARTYAALADS